MGETLCGLREALSTRSRRGEAHGRPAFFHSVRVMRRGASIHAGAQRRVRVRELRVRDISDFKDFHVLEPPRGAAVHSPVHDS
jgi:hypothetical protein